MKEAIRLYYRNYFNFSSRTSRRDYWLAQGYLILGTVIVQLLLMFPRTELLLAAWVLGNIIPSLSIAIRRYHDRNYTGWIILAAFIPAIGTFILLFISLLEGTPGPNRFGLPTNTTASPEAGFYEEEYAGLEDEWEEF